jgi:hypothetical protein
LPEALRDSALPIAADLFVAALTDSEYDGVLMRINHSCEPNVGMGGNVLLVAMRDIAAGEELTIDYALFLSDTGFAMDCRCRTAACRGIVTGPTGCAPACATATEDGFPGGSSRRCRHGPAPDPPYRDLRTRRCGLP